ncbi:DNA binding protein [Reticulomyxa filosa]|uniref:DNA binding protein n=1 Tax=Reticulomyxa filosa TaxID=46433 RepID=X6NM81_RETFI|nr:DNA binding protein [Reticulomyxa filosa]|eukprot:ETO27028.1 DNA binding protein [Reticulomyxa filosa]
MSAADSETPLTLYPELKRLKDESEGCCDCDDTNAEWASINLGAFLCAQCAGVHRSLGAHVTKVRSLTLDTWDESWVKNMKLSQDFNRDWEYHVPESYTKPRRYSSRKLREHYIACKYAGIPVDKQSKSGGGDASNGSIAAEKVAAADEQRGSISSSNLRPLFHKSNNADKVPQRPVYDTSEEAKENEKNASSRGITGLSKKELNSMVKTDGVLMLRVIGCTDLPRADTLSDSDPYAVFDSQYQQVKTKTIDNNNSPVWNENLMLTVKEDAPVKIRVYDADEVGDDDLIGYATLSVAHDCKPQQEIEFKLKLIVPSKYVKQKKTPVLHFYATFNKLA